MRWGELYKLCGATGLSVAEMKKMSLWEVYKYREGYVETKVQKAKPRLTEEEVEAEMAAIMDFEPEGEEVEITAAEWHKLQTQKPR